MPPEDEKIIELELKEGIKTSIEMFKFFTPLLILGLGSLWGIFKIPITGYEVEGIIILLFIFFTTGCLMIIEGIIISEFFKDKRLLKTKRGLRTLKE